MRNKEKGSLLLALTRLVQVITLILLLHVIQLGLALIAGSILFIFKLTQPIGVI